MADFKIFKKGNYLKIQNINTGELFNGLLKEVFVDKNNLNNPLYKFFNVKDWSDRLALNISQIKKEDGSDYTQEEWETFYTENTGNFNTPQASGGSVELIVVFNSNNTFEVFTPIENSDISRGEALKLAENYAIDGSTIIVYAGTYDCCNLGKNGVSYEFLGDSKIIYNGDVNGANIFTDNDEETIINVNGGTFINNATVGSNDTIRMNNENSIFNINCKNIQSINNRALAIYAGTIKCIANQIIAKDGTIDVINSENNSAFVSIEANEIISLENYAIEHDGGDVIINAKKLQTLSNDPVLPCITTASGSGNLFINCDEIISNGLGIEATSMLTKITIKNALFNTTLNNYVGGFTEKLFFDNCRNNSLTNKNRITGDGGCFYLDKNKKIDFVINFNGTSNPNIVYSDSSLDDDFNFVRDAVGSFSSSITFPYPNKTILKINPTYNLKSNIFIDGIEGGETYELKLQVFDNLDNLIDPNGEYTFSGSIEVLN